MSGLGGWDLNVHHTYSPNGKTVLYGNGERRNAKVLNRVINTIPGLQLDTASVGAGVAPGPDGSLYVTDFGNGRILRVLPDGTVSTIAGGGSAAGDGIPATQAGLDFPTDVAIGPDGSLYIAEGDNARARRVDTNGIIWTVAGNGFYPTGGTDGDGGLAVEAQVQPRQVAVGPDGALYLTERFNLGSEYLDRIRRKALHHRSQTKHLTFQASVILMHFLKNQPERQSGPRRRVVIWEVTFVAWLVLATGCASSNSTTNVTTGAHYGWGERMFRDWNRSAFEQRSESWRHFYWCPDMHYKNGESAGNQ